jgi:hypothetical protein
VLWAGSAALALLLVSALHFPVLSVTYGGCVLAMRLPENGRYSYSYVNSIYSAPVDERHVREGGELRVVEVLSSDIRAVEYFRWAGQPEQSGGRWTQAAPPNETPRLVIRITPAYHQELRGDGWTIDLAQRFGDGVVSVTPEYLPALTAIPLGWRP